MATHVATFIGSGVEVPRKEFIPWGEVAVLMGLSRRMVTRLFENERESSS
jgi:hypothetical protein